MSGEGTKAVLHDPVADRVGYLLRRASSAMIGDLAAALAGIGLRPVEATILLLVGANPGCIQSDIGRILGIKRANMAPLIAALGAKGLVAKAPSDGRSLALFLTEEGQAARDRSRAMMDAHEQRFEAVLGSASSEHLADALRRIIAASGRDDAGDR